MLIEHAENDEMLFRSGFKYQQNNQDLTCTLQLRNIFQKETKG